MKTPRDYQLVAIERGAKQDLLIADDRGLGKTLMAVEVAKLLPKGPRLVVAPMRVKPQWIQEIEEQFPPTRIVNIGKEMYPRSKKRHPEGFTWKQIRDTPNIWVITHYEALLKLTPDLMQVRWELFVLDEVHRIKNRRAKRTMWAKMIKAKRKIGLTGTLMENLPDDMWSPLNWIDKKIFSSYWRFYNAFVEFEIDYFGYKKPIGVKRPERLAEIINPHIIRRTKEDVAPELPPKIMQRIPVEMTKQQKNIYDQIAASRDIEVKVAGLQTEDRTLVVPTILAKIVRCQQVSSDPRLLDFDVDSGKIKWLEQFIYDNPNEATIVFTRFRRTALYVASRFGGLPLVGGMKLKDIIPFLTGKKKLLCGTIQAMGEGLNLQMASTSIFLDQTWSSTQMNQAVDRIHRIGITTPKHIIYLYSEDSVDKLVLKALDSKWSNAELVYYYLDQEAENEF